MSPFIIYLIVLTVAYLLYYIALITIDLHSKPKRENEEEETLDTSDMDDEQEEQREDIAEVEEETEEQASLNDEEVPEEPLAEPLEFEEEKSEIVEPEAEESKEEDKVPVEEEIDGINRVAFVENEPMLLKQPKADDKGPAFDPNINEPTYGVKEVMGPQKSDTSVSRKAETLNNALEMTKTKGNQYNSQELLDMLMSDEETKKKNFEVKNEATRM